MKSTSKSSSKFETRWALAASVAPRLFEDLATRLLDGKRWTVLEGEKGFSALTVGDDSADPQLAAVFMARNDCAVYLLDFDDEAPSIVEFDHGKKRKHRGHPAAFLKDHGVVAPGYEPPPPSPVRSVLVIEGVSPKAAMKLGFDALDHAEHPRGTLVTGRVATVAKDYAKKFGGPVYTLSYNNATGHFWCSIEERGNRGKLFDPSPGQLAEFYDKANDVLGETTFEGICQALQVPVDLLRDPNG